MSVGATISSDQANNILTSVAREVQADMQSAVRLWNWIATLGADQAAQQAALVAMPNGFTSADAAAYWKDALASWAIPNGIPADPSENRLAVRTEDLSATVEAGVTRGQLNSRVGVDEPR